MATARALPNASACSATRASSDSAGQLRAAGGEKSALAGLLAA
jgi:hypothetical protein